MGRKMELRSILSPPPPPPPSPLAPATSPKAFLATSPCVNSPCITSPCVTSPLAYQPRRKPLTLRDNVIVRKPGFAELAGGTAAGCAAVWCCVPCGVLDFLVLTVVRLPAGLCRKAIRKRRLCLKNQKKQIGTDVWINDNYGSLVLVKSMTDAALWPEMSMSEEFVRDMDEEMMAMDEEMWERFGGTGFWRSPSRKNT